jgi:crotonobetainyl-CoA:carnitine CoA-transferase CaiB-like acyl-CoA transferase
MANGSEAVAILDAHLATRTLAEWQAALTGMSGQWAVVQDTVEVTNDPAVVANEYLQTAETEDGVSFRLVSPPVVFDEEPSSTRRAPQFNEHGDDILTTELGMDWDAVVDLKVRGVVA